MATVRCATACHLMILTKEAFDEVIGKMEKRILNDKINFLRNIPVFALLTRNSLAKLTPSLIKKTIQKDAYLYREGDVAKIVYIVIKGEFEITKTIAYRNQVENKIEDIFKDPLRAIRKNSKYF